MPNSAQPEYSPQFPAPSRARDGEGAHRGETTEQEGSQRPHHGQFRTLTVVVCVVELSWTSRALTVSTMSCVCETTNVSAVL